ncbi:serine/threonine-protein kinase-like protein At5g23170 [Sesamum indicum]|uniref:Serine/threonine-protein kinase-like protein At5g23170 n=1 Tax=Sesamum indicum TaxID=4182 RepID=A0A6I9U5S2_SESIN|nr:serine/threonine-protein kinase-like protein At5g23170 [Sesamum indicum]
MKEFDLQELEVATDGFSPSRIVGKGSHGSVYRGILKDGNHVAIKKQSLGLQKLGDNTKLENEARILSSLHPHPCLINLLGISYDSFGNKILVTEYMPNGTLHEILHLSAMPLSWPKRVEFAIHIAKGVGFIHESDPSIVHRDIKSANVLVDKNWKAKVADFGLAIREDELNVPAGTIGYLDPGYTTPCKLSTKTDVFSYGVLLLELISSRKVIDVVESPASIVEWAVPLIQKGRMMEVVDKRVVLPQYTRRSIKQLLRMAARCLSPTEALRPCMPQILAILESSILSPVPRPLSINLIPEIILKILKSKKMRISGTCEDHDIRSKKMSKHTLPVREILIDLTLK